MNSINNFSTLILLICSLVAVFALPVEHSVKQTQLTPDFDNANYVVVIKALRGQLPDILINAELKFKNVTLKSKL